jgi:hypothetical protein
VMPGAQCIEQIAHRRETRVRSDLEIAQALMGWPVVPDDPRAKVFALPLSLLSRLTSGLKEGRVTLLYHFTSEEFERGWKPRASVTVARRADFTGSSMP